MPNLAPRINKYFRVNPNGLLSISSNEDQRGNVVEYKAHNFTYTYKSYPLPNNALFQADGVLIICPFTYGQ